MLKLLTSADQAAGPSRDVVVPTETNAIPTKDAAEDDRPFPPVAEANIPVVRPHRSPEEPQATRRRSSDRKFARLLRIGGSGSSTRGLSRDASRLSRSDSGVKTRDSLSGPVPSSSGGLKSCMSVNSLADSLKSTGLRGRIESMPDLAVGGGDGVKRNVSFHRIEIREYERTISDNPAVSSGPAIGIGWRYDPDSAWFDLERYEETRSPRRSSNQMQMPRNVRERVLRTEANVSGAEIREMMKSINAAKHRRRSTVAQLEVAKTEEAIESVVRKVRRFVRRTSTKKEQEELWENARRVVEENAGRRRSGGSLDASLTSSLGSVQEEEAYQPPPAPQSAAITAEEDGEAVELMNQIPAGASTSNLATGQDGGSSCKDGWGFGYDEEN